MARLLLSFSLVIAVILLVCTETAGTAGPLGRSNQTPEISIRNFRAVDVSSGELRVIVDYTYLGALQNGVSIHATPEEAGGVFDPRTVENTELPVRPGTHSATLAITRRASARDFTSVAVRVCISTTERALFCQNFPHEKKWTAATPPKPSTEETCTISGRLSGPLEGVSHPDHPGPPTKVKLTHMSLMAPDRTRRTAAVRNGRYMFENLKPGVVYRLAPIGFQSKPRFQDMSCTAKTVRHVNFQIIRPNPEG